MTDVTGLIETRKVREIQVEWLLKYCQSKNDSIDEFIRLLKLYQKDKIDVFIEVNSIGVEAK